MSVPDTGTHEPGKRRLAGGIQKIAAPESILRIDMFPRVHRGAIIDREQRARGSARKVLPEFADEVIGNFEDFAIF